MNAKDEESRDLVYGVYRPDELVFMPEQEAIDRAKVWQALGTAGTWGEFKAAVPDRFYQEVIEMLAGENEDTDVDPEPEGQSPFDPTMIPGCGVDRDWPSWPAQEMLDWMPVDVQKRYGKRESTRISGDYLHLADAYGDAIVAMMREHGYECSRNDALVDDASGFSS